MSDSFLEPEFADAFHAWKAGPGPEANARMLDTLHPVIEGAVKAHVGGVNPLILSRARGMALDGLAGYDPQRSRLKTHLYNHLQGLKRVQRQQTTVLKVPERVALDRYQLQRSTDELAAELGREPSDGELADRTGFAVRRLARARSYAPPVAEGTLDAAGGGGFGGVRPTARRGLGTWGEVVYNDLDGYHQRVMELVIGLNNHRPLPNQEIARRLGKSPGAISQAKLRIQRMLDEEDELSPFGG